MSDDMTGSRVAVKAGLPGAGRTGTALGKTVILNGAEWTPVLWDYHDGPGWLLTDRLELELEAKDVPVTITLSVRTALPDGSGKGACTPGTQSLPAGIEGPSVSGASRGARLVRSKVSFVDTITAIVAMANAKFPGCEASGVDLEKLERELAVALEERNAAMSELHRVRCELEAKRVKMPAHGLRAFDSKKAKRRRAP